MTGFCSSSDSYSSTWIMDLNSSWRSLYRLISLLSLYYWSISFYCSSLKGLFILCWDISALNFALAAFVLVIAKEKNWVWSIVLKSCIYFSSSLNLFKASSWASLTFGMLLSSFIILLSASILYRFFSRISLALPYLLVCSSMYSFTSSGTNSFLQKLSKIFIMSSFLS